MRKLFGIVARSPRRQINFIPNTRPVSSRFTRSVHTRSAARTVAQFLVTAVHGAAGIVQMVLNAVSATFATQCGLAVEGGRCEQRRPHFAGSLVTLQPRAEEASRQAFFSDKVPVHRRREALSKRNTSGGWFDLIIALAVTQAIRPSGE